MMSEIELYCNIKHGCFQFHILRTYSRRLECFAKTSTERHTLYSGDSQRDFGKFNAPTNRKKHFVFH